MILFTGLTGTSGRAFVDVLRKKNYTEPFKVIVRENSNIEQLGQSGLNCELIVGDLEDEQFLVESMEGCDCVFHIAAKAKIDIVARAVAKTTSVKHCIMVSSTSIYSSFRAASDKVIAAETEMKQLFECHTIDWTIIRPTMIFGTLRDHNISTFMRWLDKYKIFPLVKNGSALLQPVNVNDIAEAYYLILSNPEVVKGKEYIVSGEKPISLKEVLMQIGHSIGKKNVFVNVPMWLANLGVRMVYFLSFKKIDFVEKLFRLTENRSFSHEKISLELGYSPKPFEYWIEQLGKEYCERKDN